MHNPLITIESVILILLQQLSQKGHQCLIVGGAVRDALLGIDPKDIDIEVYNIKYNDLVEFLSEYGKADLVGKKFGVIKFRPNGGDETEYDFSIPRMENKIGIGHKEFDVTFDLDMTPKEAAKRRDLTINALAYDPITNEVHDFFGGLDDLKNKTLRHTSDAFTEDYLRVLRLMQFQARFDFEIHPDTITLIQKMLIDNPNEFLHLSKERVCDEWTKWASKGIRRDLIFKFMRDTGLIKFYPELKALKQTPQDPVWHPEGDCEIHTALCVKHMDKIIGLENISGDEKIILVMSILLHDIAKPPTTEFKEKDGRTVITSYGHEAMGGTMAKTFLENLGFNEKLITPISNLITNHLAGVNISMITAPSGKIKAVKKLSRRLHPATVQQLLYVMEADTNGRGHAEYRVPTGADDIRFIAGQLTVTHKQYEYLLMGRHLIEKGLKPSGDFGIILKASYTAQEEGKFNDIDGAKQWLDEFLLTWDKHYFDN